MQQPPEQNPPPLEYGQRGRVPLVSRHRRLLIFLAICIAIAIPIFRYWRPLKNRATWQYRFYHATQYVMPTPLKVLEDDPEIIEKLLKENPDYLQFGQPLGPAERQPAPWALPYTAVYVPVAFRALAEVDPRLGRLSNPNPNRVMNIAIAFMGTRYRPDGTARLVIIRADDDVLTGGGFITQPHALVLPVPRLFDQPPTSAAVGSAGRIAVSISTANKKSLRGASADPTDPTHLILSYEFELSDLRNSTKWNASGTVDAYLQNDDTLMLKAPPDSPIIRIFWWKL